VALGPHVAEWAALKRELDQLAMSCRAHFVGVISTGNVLWCANWSDEELADAFYHAEIAPRRAQLRRGMPLDIAVRFGPSFCVARSFASIYVLLVCMNRHDRRTDIVHAREEIRGALPRIEALTVSLPPPNPSPAEGIGKQRA
jgi:hypothetical protein